MKSTNGRLASPWVYFLLALGWSWLFWIPLALWGRPVTEPVPLVLFVIGGAGVPVAGIGLAYLTRGREGGRDYWRRVVDFRRIGLGWYLVIFLVVPLWTGLGTLTGFLLGQGVPSFERPLELLSRPLGLLPFMLFILLYGPIPEELGWRGYALDRLQERFSALTASLVLGVLWALWHLPQFFIPGLFIREVFPPGTAAFWVAFIASLPAQSVLYTWIFNNTHRSTLSAILLHFMTNFSGEFLGVGDPWRLYAAGWIVVLTVAVAAIWGPRTLAQGQEAPAGQLSSGRSRPP